MKNTPSVEELKNEGYNSVIDLQISEESITRILTNLKLTLKL